MTTKILLIASQITSYLWHFFFFVLVLPYLILQVGQDLDWLLFNYFFKLPTNLDLFGIYLDPILVLIAGTVIVLGVNLIVKAWLTLAKEGQFFPFSIFSHQSLAPAKLVKSDVYALCRHPMLLGYSLSLIGLGIGFHSPMAVWWVVPLLTFLILEWFLITEEKELLTWFGSEYQEYQSLTPALIPRLKPALNKGSH